MDAAVWNLYAAILCTVAAAITSVALYLSDPTFVNELSLAGGLIAVLGGSAWIVAAVRGLGR
jgi:hypothetical protein